MNKRAKLLCVCDCLIVCDRETTKKKQLNGVKMQVIAELNLNLDEI